MVPSIAGALRVLLLFGSVIDAVDNPARATRAAVGRSGRLRSNGQQPRQVMPYRPSALPGALLARDGRSVAASVPGGDRRELSARQITKDLVRAEGARDIMRVFEGCSSACNDINICTVWSQLGKARLNRRERVEFFRDFEPTLHRLQLSTAAAIPRLNPRNLAGVLYGIARLGYGPADRTMALIAVEAAPRVGEFNSQELANAALAFAKAGVPAPAFLAALARACVARIRSFNGQELANTAWAFAKMGLVEPELFDAIALESEPRLDEFIPQGLSNMAWAFATSGHAADALLDAIGHAARPKLAAFKEQELSNLAWAFATSGQATAVLFDAIADEAFPRLHEFTSQGLANIVWSFAKSGVPAEALFAAVAREATGGATVAGEMRPSRLQRFNTQELANTAFAFARADIRDERLSAAIAAEALLRMHLFSEQEISNLGWAFASAGILDRKLFEAMGAALEPKVPNLSVQGLTNTMLAFAKAGWPMRDSALRLRALLGAQLEAQAHLLSAAEVANLGWSFAVSASLPAGVVRALCARAVELGAGAFALEERSALHQFFVSVALEARMPLHECAPRALILACQEAIVVQAPARSSALHLDVSTQLARLGVAHVNELSVPRLGYHVDIAILSDPAKTEAAAALSGHFQPATEGGNGFGAPPKIHAAASAAARQAVAAAAPQCRGLVIEVNGPSHYDCARKLRPESQMIRRHLTLAGWAVIEVPWWEWAAVQGVGGKANYLASLLISAYAQIAERAAESAQRAATARPPQAVEPPPSPPTPPLARPRASQADGPAAGGSAEAAGASGGASAPPRLSARRLSAAAARTASAAAAAPSGEHAAADSTDASATAERNARVIALLARRIPGISEKRAGTLRAHLGVRDPFALTTTQWRCAAVGDGLARRIHAELGALKTEAGSVQGGEAVTPQTMPCL